MRNPRLQQLQPYPFEKLRRLFADLQPGAGREHIALSIGEPRHDSPQFVLDVLTGNLDKLANYPATRGMPELRQGIARWLAQRFQLPTPDPEAQVLPVNGTREALFAFAQAVIDPVPGALVMSPNPFYQIYEGAALLAGARPRFINCTADTGLLPDFNSVSESEWRQCQLLYLCTPGNPTGAVIPLQQLHISKHGQTAGLIQKDTQITLAACLNNVTQLWIEYHLHFGLLRDVQIKLHFESPHLSGIHWIHLRLHFIPDNKRNEI